MSLMKMNRHTIAVLLCLGFVLAGALRVDAADDIASWFPANTIAFVGSDGTRALQASIDASPFVQLGMDPRIHHAVQEICEYVQKQGGAELEDFLASGKLRWAEALSKLPFGLALIDADVETERVDAAVVVAVDDELQDEFAALLDREIGLKAKRVGELDVRSDDAGSFFCCRMAQRTIIASSESALTRVVACTKGSPSLAGDAVYQRSAHGRSGNNLLRVFVNAKRIGALAPSILAKAPEPRAFDVQAVVEALGLDRLRAVSIGIDSNSGAWQTTTRVDVEGWSSTIPAVDLDDLASVPFETECVSYCRFDAVQAFESLLAAAMAFVPREKRAKIEFQVRNAAPFIGVNPGELAAALGSSCLLYDEPSFQGSFMGLVATLKPKDAAVIERFLQTLVKFGNLAARQAAPEFTITLNDYEAYGNTIHYMQITPYGVVAPAWVQHEGGMSFALLPTVLEDMLDRERVEPAGERQRLIDRKSFLQAWNERLPGATSFSYSDQAAGARRSIAMASTFGQILIAAARSEGMDIPSAAWPSPRRVARLFGVSTSSSASDANGFVSRSIGNVPGDPLLLVALIGAAAGVVVPTVVSVRERSERIEDMYRLKTFHQRCMDQLTNGYFPRSLEELDGYDPSDPFFERIVYRGGGLESTESDRILAEIKPKHGGGVTRLFVSGSVRYVPADDK